MSALKAKPDSTPISSNSLKQVHRRGWSHGSGSSLVGDRDAHVPPVDNLGTNASGTRCAVLLTLYTFVVWWWRPFGSERRVPVNHGLCFEFTTEFGRSHASRIAASGLTGQYNRSLAA